MTRRKLLPVVLTSLAILLVSLLTPAAGHAAEGRPWPGPVICAKGTVAPGTPIPGILERIPFNVNFEPCEFVDPAAVPEARWAVARYTAVEATITSFDLQPFTVGGPTIRQTWGSFTFDLQRSQAVCLVTGPTSRIACLRVTTDRTTGALVFEPLPAGDALVRKPVSINDNTGNPECGACP
jgi:hypothetical protein